MPKYLSLLFLPLFIYACNQEQKEINEKHISPKIQKTKGYEVPKDSLTAPKIVFVDETKLKKVLAGKPEVIPTNLNIYPAGAPKIILVGKPRVCTPGKDSFLLPKIVPAIDSTFPAGIPTTILAKEMASKDQNPQNFSYFSKLQGLPHNNIFGLLEDRLGNLWFGSDGGGVCKYDGRNFTNFTNAQGLAGNHVLSITEDKFGNLWFGTGDGGASKYDGKSFTNYTTAQGLANNDVRSITEDKFGNLWFGTNGGISKYDGNCEVITNTNKKDKKNASKSFTNYTTAQGLVGNKVLCITEDKSGNLWFGTNGGACKYDGKSFTHFTKKEGLIHSVVNSICEDRFGNLWFGINGGGVSKYDGKSFTQFTIKEGLGSNRVNSIMEDQSGNLWFSTYDGGCTKYDGKSFTRFTEKEGLNAKNVHSALQDKFGNFWFATISGGLYKYVGKKFTHFTANDGLTNIDMNSIMEDRSGNTWFATSGGGASKYDGKSFTHFSEKEGLEQYVMSICEDRFGNLWFGINGGGVFKYDGRSFVHFTEKEGLIANNILSVLEDRLGNLWFGTDGGGVSKYDGKSFTHFTVKEGLSDNLVCALFEDKSGNLWFGTDVGVTKYDGKKFTHFTEKHGLVSDIITSIMEDRSGNMWFSTYGGVSKYDGNSITNFTTEEGLGGKVVYGLAEDKSGNLWFGTGNGLSKLTLSRLASFNQKVKSGILTKTDIIFKNYGYEDGFLGYGVRGGGTDKIMLKSKEGTIWIGANDRVTAMHPEYLQTDTIAPNIQLTNIELFNENIAWADLQNKKDSNLTLGNGVQVRDFNFDGITKWYGIPENLNLAYNNNYLTFNFIGITMSQPKKVKYQYMLEGIDKYWSPLTNKTSVPYGNIAAGTYTFKVKAMNSDGYWSDTFAYTFTIRPPWWKTWWFKLLVGLLIIGTIWVYIKSREKKLVAEKIILEKTVKERTAEVIEQKQLIEEKHKEITDSINYAERIQRALLASKKMLDENLNDYFILFKPKDVVSGDFYWATKLINNNFVLVNADSTGHGVPGAIMSILNIACLDKAVTKGINSPDLILNETRRLVIENLKNDGSAEGGKDGMDGSLLSFDFKNNILNCASANNPIWVIRKVSSSDVENKKELIEIKADRLPIGKHDRDHIPFTLHTLNLQKGDVVYTLTDGFPDQFGGKSGKKFKHKQIQNLLLEMANEPMEIQKQKLNDVFDNWKGNLEQVDDVCLIGIRV